jgi:prolyl-tRNA synthetase
MTHGDDQGLRMPPAVASTQVVVVPIWRKADESERVLAAARSIFEALEKDGLRVRLDQREGVTPGFKFNDWEMRGVPLRIEVGPRDVAAGEAVLARRDVSGPPGKSKVPVSELAARATALLDEIQKSLFAQAKALTEANTRTFDNYEKLRVHMQGEGGGGLANLYWCGNPVCETKIREETRATCRAIPLAQESGSGTCIVCGENAPQRAFFAKAY